MDSTKFILNPIVRLQVHIKFIVGNFSIRIVLNFTIKYIAGHSPLKVYVGNCTIKRYCWSLFGIKCIDCIFIIRIYFYGQICL